MGAHRLIKLAESKNDRDLVERVINRFYKVYFTDGKSIADKDVLTAAAVEAGLDKDEVEKIFASDQYERQVVGDEV